VNRNAKFPNLAFGLETRTAHDSALAPHCFI